MGGDGLSWGRRTKNRRGVGATRNALLVGVFFLRGLVGVVMAVIVVLVPG